MEKKKHCDDRKSSGQFDHLIKTAEKLIEDWIDDNQFGRLNFAD
jgi:hypothetical protein